MLGQVGHHEHLDVPTIFAFKCEQFAGSNRKKKQMNVNAGETKKKLLPTFRGHREENGVKRM